MRGDDGSKQWQKGLCRSKRAPFSRVFYPKLNYNQQTQSGVFLLPLDTPNTSGVKIYFWCQYIKFTPGIRTIEFYSNICSHDFEKTPTYERQNALFNPKNIPQVL